MPNFFRTHPAREWLWQFVLAALYVLSGLLTQRGAIFDGHASQFWPASGLALGALLLGGGTTRLSTPLCAGSWVSCWASAW